MKTKVTKNAAQKVYVIPCGTGYTYLGFSVCQKRAKDIAAEIGYEYIPAKIGTLKAYKQYQKILKSAAIKYKVTGWKSKSQLIPQFIGQEGRRVEVVDRNGETRRFYIGKSTGFIPCHLEISRANSSGGHAATGYPFQSIKFIK